MGGLNLTNQIVRASLADCIGEADKADQAPNNCRCSISLRSHRIFSFPYYLKTLLKPSLNRNATKASPCSRG